jgi:hypothetical protein
MERSTSNGGSMVRRRQFTPTTGRTMSSKSQAMDLNKISE